MYSYIRQDTIKIGCTLIAITKAEFFLRPLLGMKKKLCLGVPFHSLVALLRPLTRPPGLTISGYQPGVGTLAVLLVGFHKLR